MHSIVIQLVTDSKTIPLRKDMRKWAKAAIQSVHKTAEITLRIVNVPEMTKLNELYRQKKGSTNVLSFPYALPNDLIPNALIGDIVICADVVNEEAFKQNKTVDAHWAHIIIHGVLHLQGFDHETEKEAHCMETLEIQILSQFGYNNPYEMEQNEQS